MVLVLMLESALGFDNVHKHFLNPLSETSATFNLDGIQKKIIIGDLFQ
jgi:hypothetical protein